jgi:hypothetical protein
LGNFDALLTLAGNPIFERLNAPETVRDFHGGWELREQIGFRTTAFVRVTRFALLDKHHPQERCNAYDRQSEVVQ